MRQVKNLPYTAKSRFNWKLMQTKICMNKNIIKLLYRQK